MRRDNYQGDGGNVVLVLLMMVRGARCGDGVGGGSGGVQGFDLGC